MHSSRIDCHAITAAQLASPAAEGWLTNGGTLSSQRYSPLEQINRHDDRIH